MSRRYAALGLMTALTAGCYRYAPIGTETPVSGAEVRLALGPGATPELYRVVGERTTAVESRITSMSDTGAPAGLRSPPLGVTPVLAPRLLGCAAALGMTTLFS